MHGQASRRRDRRRRLRRARSGQGAAACAGRRHGDRPQNHHCFQPLLYQVATAALSPADVAWPIRHILRGQQNATVLMAEVIGVDTAQRQVHTRSGAIAYDQLVVATGATHSYFGHDEWAGVRARPEAHRGRDPHPPAAFCSPSSSAELSTDASERRRLLTFVIVGGGATGVEMAGAIAEIARRPSPTTSAASIPRTARIVLLEAGPRVLPALPQDLSDYAAARPDPHGRRGANLHAGDQLRCPRRRSRSRTHRRRHPHLGRRRRGLTRCALAQRRA